MARPALTEDQRREIRRRIRDAAARLHTEVGLSGISARAVAERAGVSVGTLYGHFGSLSELMQSLWRTPASRLVHELVRVSEATSEPVERLRELLQAYVRFAADNEQVFRAAFLYVRPESRAAPEQISLQDDRFFRVFRRTIEAGQEQGVFRDGDPELLTQTVLSAVHGALALPVTLHRLALDRSTRVPAQAIEAMLEWLHASPK